MALYMLKGTFKFANLAFCKCIADHKQIMLPNGRLKSYMYVNFSIRCMIVHINTQYQLGTWAPIESHAALYHQQHLSCIKFLTLDRVYVDWTGCIGGSQNLEKMDSLHQGNFISWMKRFHLVQGVSVICWFLLVLTLGFMFME